MAITPQKLRCLGLVAGDGIGKEVIPAAQRVLECLFNRHGMNVKFISDLKAGYEEFQRSGNALPDRTIHALRECDGGLFGAVSSPSHRVRGYTSPIVSLRKQLDLYANIRPVKAHTPLINMVIVRENTECLYVKRERLIIDEGGHKTAIAERQISENATRKCAKLAFNLALKLQMNKVTIVHKANILSITDGLWRETIHDTYQKECSAKSPIVLNEQLVDSMVYRLFKDPHNFQIILAPNMYGDIISDAGAGLVGSLGMVPGANVGDNFVLAEPVHGSAPDIAGQGKANPIAAIRSAALLLNTIGHVYLAAQIEKAIDKTLLKGIATPDIGGTNTTDEVANSICELL